MPTENRSSNTEQMVSDLSPCDHEVYSEGESVCLVDIPKETAESICQGLSAAVGRKIDWHYIGGRVHIKVLAQPANQQQGDPVAWTNETTLAWMRRPNSGYAQISACAVASEPVALYLHPPTFDGYSAGDMADQGAKAFAARDGEIEDLREQLAGRDALLHRMKNMFRQDDPCDLSDAVCGVLEASNNPA